MENSENKTINWYPGHMFKAKKEVQSALKATDMVIEIIDARCPISSHNEMLEQITKNKLKLIVFSKADLVDKSKLKKYENYFKIKNLSTLTLNIHKNTTKKEAIKKIEEINEEIFQKFKSKGINKTLRIMVIGMPNVGKSTFINALASKKKTEVGNKPGVTKSQQTIRVSENIELVDTPGILIPKIEHIETGYNLVLNSLIKDQVVELEQVAFYLLNYLINNQTENLLNIYPYLKENKNLSLIDDLQTTEQVYTNIARSVGFTNKSNENDYEKISIRIINDYRKQKFGKIILDKINYE